MKITKFGHCCLLIAVPLAGRASTNEVGRETNGVRILTDPGNFTSAQDTIKNIDLLLITHEHQDHYHVESVKKIVANNPNITIITNKAVGALLDKEGIKYQVVGENQSTTFSAKGGSASGGKNILIEGFGHEHATIYEQFGKVENTGYFIDGKLFYPGDAFTDPGKPVEILAVPAGGPWMKASEAIDYAKKIKPTKAFPVHDGMFIHGANFTVSMMQMILAKEQIDFRVLELEKETEF